MRRLWNLITGIIFKLNITSHLALQNVALRQQLVVMQRNCQKPHIRNTDRLFWVLLSRLWENWQETLVIVKPETVVKWHRKGFKLFWKYKSRSRGPGRTRVSKEIRNLVCRMANANPLWAAPRI